MSGRGKCASDPQLLAALVRKRPPAPKQEALTACIGATRTVRSRIENDRAARSETLVLLVREPARSRTSAPNGAWSVERSADG